MTRNVYLVDWRRAFSEAMAGWIVLLLGALAFTAVATLIVLKTGDEKTALLAASILIGSASLWMFPRVLNGLPRRLSVAHGSEGHADADVLVWASAAAHFLHESDRSSEIAIVFGRVLALRLADARGGSRIVSSTLSSRQVDFLSHNPTLLKEPARLLELLPTDSFPEREN